MTYREAINLGEKVLNMADVADAKIDAWLLLEMVCKIDRSFYYLHMEDEVAEEQLSEYEIALRKRAEHVPLQYIVGEAEFMGLKFKVNSNVLIPRQDTETLVEEALKVVKPGMKVLDLCTGSGCIIVSIVHNVPEVEGTATDISKQALLVAKENAKLNQVSVTFERSDLFDNVTGTYDVIVSNPPYIRTGEVVKLMPEVQEFEPMEALDGKEDGLYFYRKIIKECKAYLKPGGHILFEIGYDQGEAVSGLLKEAGFKNVTVIKDLAHNDRVVTGMETGTYDVIVSNPPYIRTGEVVKLMPEVQEFEPMEALDGKEDGLYFYRKIIKECKAYLKPGGHILFEIGYDQGEAVSGLLKEAGFKNVTVIKDLAHNDRVVTGMEDICLIN